MLGRLLLVADLVKGVAAEMEESLLVWRDPANEVRWIKVFDGLVVGRAPDCDLVLPGKRVSRRHLRIRHTDLGPAVEDLKSRNGTRINGRAIASEPRVLLSGDVIDCGGVAVVFVS